MTEVAIIGGGPAGLTASYLLSKKGVSVHVLEADPQYVGGISRTAEYKGFHFDIGGHRFFSKSKEVEDLWTELLPNDMLDRPRKSRIFYGRKFYSYPLRAFEALFNLGILQSTLCVLSYIAVRIAPKQNPTNFEDWVTNQFGKRLFQIFFKTYTEKVWGMKCNEISADWAAQRIKGLSLGSAIWNALKPARKPGAGQPVDRSQVIKTLIDSFRYPRKGPGMVWDSAHRKTINQGGTVTLGAKVTGLTYSTDAGGHWVVSYQTTQGEKKSLQAKQVISSAPMRELVKGIEPQLATRELADKLRYRDFLTVALIVRDTDAFDDNWIYIHDPSVKVGRIQNFKSWSPEMVPDSKLNCYGLEYFCFEGDGVWAAPDSELIALAKKELVSLGLAKNEDILDGTVVRQAKAYPVYDDQYAEVVEKLRTEMSNRYPTLHLVGRNGMHKYNNQDHAMMTAMLTVENILAGKQVYDIWQVNQDAEYHESGNAGAEHGASGLRSVPERVQAAQ